jgi:hypothetical protein
MGRGIKRVVDAFKRHLPDEHTLVNDWTEADFVIFHVVGVQNFSPTVDLPTQIEMVKKAGKRYAMMQYCLRTTERPEPSFWLPLWAGADVVWSYYDLAAYWCPNFYRAPLGVDASVFYPRNEHKVFTIGTSGYVAETEGAQECYDAIRIMGGTQVHLGPALKLGPNFAYRMNISDDDVARLWSQCRFVSGLRRVEGFELPAAEAMLCGVRPILFDRPHYRQWFGEDAYYVHEDTPAIVTEELAAIFTQGYPTLSHDAILRARKRFDWTILMREFWRRVA